MLLGRPTEFKAVPFASLFKFTIFHLVTEACVWYRARASEGGILNLDCLTDGHPML